MSFFKKKKNDEPFFEPEQDVEFGKRVHNITRRPDVLTPEEVLNIGSVAEESDNNNALEALKRKLTKMEAEPEEEAEDIETTENTETIEIPENTEE